MFEYHDGHESIATEHHSHCEADIPEPLETWSLEDFEEFLPA